MAAPGIDAVVIGTSWGGLAAITTVLSGIRWNQTLPIILCQHQYPHARSRLVDVLRVRTRLKVMEIEDKMPVEPGILYVCPPNYHTLVEREGRFSLNVDPPVMYSRPSIDVLFESAAEAWGQHLLGIVLTGANEDGANGLVHVTRCGGVAIVQKPETAEVATMPAAALAKVPWAQVMTLEEIGAFISGLTPG